MFSTRWCVLMRILLIFEGGFPSVFNCLLPPVAVIFKLNLKWLHGFSLKGAQELSHLCLKLILLKIDLTEHFER